MKLNKLVTEGRNEKSREIDKLDTLGILKVINNEDKGVAIAVEKELINIEKAVEAIVEAFKDGGRLIYMGAGTSGRLGILDASECPPTYGTSHEQVVGLIAGGRPAILKAVENAEDSREFGIEDLKNIDLKSNDVVVGIAASGRTPYVVAGLEYANRIGAKSVAISCNRIGAMVDVANISITPVVGAEVVTGSSRMKAGTAQKLVLNMLTTASMIKMGKVYGNLMVDVEATNEKLVERQKKIVIEATGVSRWEAQEALNKSNGSCKLAIFIILSGLEVDEARKILDEEKGYIRKALGRAARK